MKSKIITTMLILISLITYSCKASNEKAALKKDRTNRVNTAQQIKQAQKETANSSINNPKPKPVSKRVEKK